jgi:membrane-associated protease RseP (regulator of RpoE activity)
VTPPSERAASPLPGPVSGRPQAWRPDDYYPNPGWTAELPAPARPNRVWVHLLLLLLTVVSTTGWGALHYLAFLSRFGISDPPMNTSAVVGGLWYSVTVLLILGCHEMGHYVACRVYQIRATLPYFLPAPIVFSGTFGAVIRIRDHFPDRKALFDVGIAGPLAGFAVLVPALFLGLHLSTIDRLPADVSGLSLGEPLLFRLASWLVWGAVKDGYSINLHPVALAAWLGLVITAVNLVPMAQLDGGHIAYATLGRRNSARLTLLAYLTMVGLAVYYRSLSYLVFLGLVTAVLFMTRTNHPPTMDDNTELGAGRRLLAVAAVVILVLSFTPVPIELIELLPK